LKVLAPTLEEPTDPLLAAIFGDIPAEAGELFEHCLNPDLTHKRTEQERRSSTAAKTNPERLE
jgi:hypothetical protein